MKRRYTPSLRTKFLLAVLLGAVLPLAVFGLWLTGTAERSAEALLRSRLKANLSQVVGETSERWLTVRSELLDLCESPSVQMVLADSIRPGPPLYDAGGAVLDRRFQSLESSVHSVAIKDRSGAVRVRLPAEGAEPRTIPLQSVSVLPVSLPVYDPGSGIRIGVLEARLRLSSILPETTWGGVAGSLLLAFHPTSGAALSPVPFDPALLSQDRFDHSDGPWVNERVTLHEPPLELAMAAPLTPFMEPFSDAARQNLLLLLVVTAAGTVLALLLSWPVTRALGSLVEAAEGVSRGSLDETVDESRSDEVGRLAKAFNTMTASLRGTLHRLSQQEALASVGEFAAGLAHEVRNPLTSMRVDLQRAEEKLPPDSEARSLIEEVLSQVDRVDRSVTGALRLARSGQVDRGVIDLREPLAAAAHEAEPRFRARDGAFLPLELGPEPLWVDGNAAALQQLFLNLLLNAAEALGGGGRAGVGVDASPGVGEEAEKRRVKIVVWDEGKGVPPEAVSMVFDPFYSTRPEGTGLGLAIAQRIAVAHGGSLTMESVEGEGTRMILHLPRVQLPPKT